MTQLIFAVDTPAAVAAVPRLIHAGVTFFKLNAWSMMSVELFGDAVLPGCGLLGHDLMLDLKVYDTRDTVDLIAKRAFAFARFLTVFADRGMLEAAMEQKRRPDQRVIAVGQLTDGGGSVRDVSHCLDVCDGVVCSPTAIETMRQVAWPRLRDQIFVCPGVRSHGCPKNNHRLPVTPAQAARRGADYVVVGRPIYEAPDPVAAAVAIMEELKAIPCPATKEVCSDSRCTTTWCRREEHYP